MLVGTTDKESQSDLAKRERKGDVEVLCIYSRRKKEKRRAVFLLCEERRKQLKMMLRRLKWFSTIICFCTPLKSLNQVRLYAELTKNLG